MAIKNARLFEETRRHHEEMAALNAIGQDITSSLDLDETLQRIVDSTRRLTGARRSRILLINPRARQVLRDVISGYPPEERGTYDYERFEQGISGWVVREKRSTLVPDVLADERSVGQSRAASIRHDTKSVAVAPLMVRGEVIGTLSAVNLREDSVFTPQGMALVEQLAAQAAIAIENARLFEKTEHLKAFNESIVQGVAEAILIEDAQGLFTFANLAAEELLGYTREELIGLHWTTIVPEEQVENVRQELAKRPQGIESCYETVLLSKEGQRIPVIVSARPLLKGGQFVGVLSAFTDITERVRAEEALRESEERYRHIFDQSPIGIGIASFDGKIVAASKAMQVMTGYSLEELKKIDLARTYENPEDRKALLEAIGQYGSVADFPVRLKRKDGAPYDALLTVSRINLGGKDLLHTICQDITERKRAEREIEERRVYLEGVLGAAPDAIVSVDARYRIVEWNRGAERLFGYSREEAIGQDLDHLVANPDTFEEAIGFTKMVMNGKELPPTETVRYRKDGSPVDVIVAGSPIRVEGEFIGAVAVYTDITARVRMEEALLALALVDELTGLYNRRGFVTLAEQQLKMANRMRRKMVLLFADFDGLKQINDAFGHPEGDRALIEVAHIFRETFRESDIMARLGGDEFVVLAVETDRASAEVLATRLRESLEARNAKADRRYKLSLSVGVARYDPEHPCSMDELLVRADRVMYERKGCNQNS
jgi:diguanylate cyclase (GGDEF)-like protein/PAS domain S-box-containing protein